MSSKKDKKETKSDIRRLNVVLDELLAKELKIYTERTKLTKKQVISEALKLLLTIKREEQILTRDNPNSFYRAKVVLEATNDDLPESMASILIY